MTLSTKDTCIYIVQFWYIIIVYCTDSLIPERIFTWIPSNLRGRLLSFLLYQISPRIMRGFMIAVIIYIHTVILPSTGNIPFACEKKTAHFLYIKTQRQKTWIQTDKNSIIRRDTKCFQNQSFHIEVTK